MQLLLLSIFYTQLCFCSNAGISYIAPHLNNLYFLTLCQRYGVYQVIRWLFVLKLGLSVAMLLAGADHIYLLCIFIARYGHAHTHIRARFRYPMCVGLHFCLLVFLKSSSFSANTNTPNTKTRRTQVSKVNSTVAVRCISNILCYKTFFSWENVFVFSPACTLLLWSSLFMWPEICLKGL